MKARLCIIFFLLTSNQLVQAQMRIHAESGPGMITERGFKGYVNTAFGLSWRYENISWGLQYGFMNKTYHLDPDHFTHCDSFSQHFDWGSTCAEGHDTVILTDYTNIFKLKSIDLRLIWLKDLGDHYSMANGVKYGLHFFSRAREIHHPLFPEVSKDNAIGFTISYINRMSWYPFEKKSNGEIFLETDLGLFYAPKPRCSDANCGSFFVSTGNFNGNIQLGIAIDLE